MTPLRCRHCGRELHLETFLALPVSPLSVCAQRLTVLLRRPLEDLLRARR
jgi:hypothetical protein